MIQTEIFSKDLDELISKRKLRKEDFEDFELQLIAFPDHGGCYTRDRWIRKKQIKATSKGKSGGFRICYCDVPEKEKLFLVAFFSKNVKEDLSFEEKRYLKQLVEKFKKEY